MPHELWSFLHWRVRTATIPPMSALRTIPSNLYNVSLSQASGSFHTCIMAHRRPSGTFWNFLELCLGGLLLQFLRHPTLSLSLAPGLWQALPVSPLCTRAWKLPSQSHLGNYKVHFISFHLKGCHLWLPDIRCLENWYFVYFKFGACSLILAGNRHLAVLFSSSMRECYNGLLITPR